MHHLGITLNLLWCITKSNITAAVSNHQYIVFGTVNIFAFKLWSMSMTNYYGPPMRPKALTLLVYPLCRYICLATFGTYKLLYAMCKTYFTAHLFWANTIRFLDKTLATQHLNPQNAPQKCPPKYDQKMTQKMAFQNDPSKLSPLIHAHKAQDRAEIKIIRYMRRVKTEFLSSKLVRFS